jgi:hypothetical protein
MDIKQINKKIKSIKTRGKSLDKDIHETGVAIMRHAKQHHDYTAANRLVDAMPKSGRTKAFIKWFSDHTPYNWNEKDKVFKLPKNKDNRRAFLIDEANTVPFWEYTVEMTPVAIDVDKLCQFVNILDQANKRLEKAEETKGDKAAFLKRAALFNKLSEMSVEDIMVKLNA